MMLGRLLLFCGSLWTTLLSPVGTGVVFVSAPSVCLEEVEVFGITVGEALTGDDWEPWRNVERCTSVIEIFAGRSVIYFAAVSGGRAAYAIDHNYDGAGMNLCFVRPFLNVVRLLLSVHEQGLCWQAPCCSSMVFANTANTHREWSNPAGDLCYDKVITGNILARVSIWVVAFCVLRKIICIIEQPRRTWFYELPFVKPIVDFLLQSLLAWFATFDMCVFDERPDGHRTFKPRKLLLSNQAVAEAFQTFACSCALDHGGKLMYTNTRGQVLPVNGGKSMTESAAYPWPFGQVVIDEWLSAVSLLHSGPCHKRRRTSLHAIADAKGDSWQVPSDDE